MKLTDFSAFAYNKNAGKNSTSSQNSNLKEVSDEKIPALQVLNDNIKTEKLAKTVRPFVPQTVGGKTPASSASASKPQVTTETQNNPNPSVVNKALSEGGLIKVPVQPKNANGSDNVYRRVAKFLMLIGTDEAAKVLSHLSPEQTQKIIPELATIRSVEKKEAAAILEEFKALIARAREDGGVDTARNILQKAFGSEKAEKLIDKAVPFKNGKPFDYLSETDSEKVSLLLKDESGAVRALVCSHLQPKIAAGFIQKLPENEKKEVILRLAKLKEMNPEIIARVDEAMQKKYTQLVSSNMCFDAENPDSQNRIDGKNVLAQILKRMDGGAEEKIINQLSENDPDLGSDLRERLFTNEDIINADDRFLQNKLQQMENDEIAFLIAAKTEDFRNKILSNVSENRKKMILDEEERRKPMLRSDVEKVTAIFFSYMRRAWEEGKYIIKGRDDEIYV